MRRMVFVFTAILLLFFIAVFLYINGKAINIILNNEPISGYSDEKVRVKIDNLSPVDLTPGQTKKLKLSGKNHEIIVETIDAKWAVKQKFNRKIITLPDKDYVIKVPSIIAGRKDFMTAIDKIEENEITAE